MDKSAKAEMPLPGRWRTKWLARAGSNEMRA